MSALAVAAPDDRALEDLDLVAAVRAGDDRAFETLFLRYQPRIAAYVGGMVRDHGRAEDITQEVFMAALRRLRTDDEREILFRPWIYEIAKNKCIDAYRRGRNAAEISFDADQIGAADHGRLAAPAATPDAAVEGKVAFDHLRGAFGGLSPVHHEILVMREFEGLSYREIGDRLGMSRTAVESTLFRARKRLGEEYAELVSGKRCLLVQRIVDEGGGRAAGLRDQRRVARHLAHCQPCRRYAHLAGADRSLLRPPSVAVRVAAFLPLPGFLRRRLGGGEEATQLLGQQAARPAMQWSHLAGAVDPGTVSSWAKAAATAATVALAGVGGSAVEHRATEAASPSAATAAGVVEAQARFSPARGEAPALPPPAGEAATPAAASPASSASSSTDAAPPAPGDPGAAHSPTAAGADSTTAAADPQQSPGGAVDSPLAPADAAVTPVLDAAGDTAGGPGRQSGGGDAAPADVSTAPGRLNRPILPHGGLGVATGPDKPLPKPGGDRAPAADRPLPPARADAPESTSAVAPGRSGDAPGRNVPARGAAADAHRPAHAANPTGAALNLGE